MFIFFVNPRLVSLQFLSADHNELHSVPTEICHLINLTELHLADNQISRYYKLNYNPNMVFFEPRSISQGCCPLACVAGV